MLDSTEQLPLDALLDLLRTWSRPKHAPASAQYCCDKATVLVAKLKQHRPVHHPNCWCMSTCAEGIIGYTRSQQSLTCTLLGCSPC